MAMMRYGRFSPNTTDPKTGARIADPEVQGQILPDGSRVASWPELRNMFQAGTLNEDFFGKNGTKDKPTQNRYGKFPQEVKNYLEGKTDKLDDVNYEEPVIGEDYAEIGSKRKFINARLNLKVNSPKWKAAIKKGTPPGQKYTPSEEGVNQQVDIGDMGGSYGETYGASTIRERKPKIEYKTPTPGPTPDPTPPTQEKGPSPELKSKPAKSLLVDVPTVPGAIEWKDPEPKKYKTTRSVVKSREGGQDQKTRIFSKKIDGGSGIRRSKTVDTEAAAKGIRYNREQKAAKSFYAPKDALGFGGYYAMTDQAFDEQGNSVNVAKLVKSKRQDIRGAKQEFRQNTSLKGAEKREGLKGYRESMKTNREATREARQGKLMPIGDQKWQEGSNSRLKYYTPDIDKTGSRGAMFNYVSSAERDIDIIKKSKSAETANIINATASRGAKAEKFYKAAEDNATNRNSAQARIAKQKGWNRFVQ